MKQGTTILRHILKSAAMLVVLLVLINVNVSFAQENETIEYRVVAVQDSGNQLSISNYLTVRYPFQVYVPNAFTPNGDGLNDVFQVKGESIYTFEIKIYDRNGHEVFRSNSVAEGWDGTLNGQKMPAGAYGFEMFAEGEELGKFQKSGVVIIAY